MSEHPIWYLPSRNPSITERIEGSDGELVDLSGGVKFMMRRAGDDTALIDAAATPLTPVADDDPNVQYDWTAANITAIGEGGTFIVWWRVTSSGKTQDLGEAIIEWRAHAPLSHAYVELEELKSTAQLTGTSFADPDLQRDIVTASRIVDDLTGRRFWLDTDATSVRYYTPRHANRLYIDDVVDMASFQTDAGGDGTYEDTWTLNEDFVLEPLNAEEDGRPFDLVRAHPTSSLSLPGYPRSVKVTGQFGWLAVPAGVKSATVIIATRVMKRAREAPFGVAGIGPDGEAVRIARSDPDVQAALAPLTRTQVLA